MILNGSNSTIVFGRPGVETTGLGGKAAALARANRPQILGDAMIPPWFVVTAGAAPPVDAGGQDNGAHAQAVRELPADLRAALIAAIAQLAPGGERVAVRSSAVDEDGAARSFAGQYESFLNVTPDDVPARLLDVWQSAVAARVLAYRREQGLAEVAPLPAVLIQRMVEAQVAGVAFSADPVSGRRGIAVVAAGAGLGDRLVAGDVDADTFEVDREGRVTLRAQQGAQPVLDERMVQRVAALARRLAAHFGRPQDVEWAVADGQLYLLQSRPITTLVHLVDPDGALTIWDNSNIIESYGGTTTPLTYSFARRAYAEVYQAFCRVLGVSSAKIQENQDVFGNMIGLIRGRIYYNLLNWYRVLAMLPGFRANRRFMEQMMGVKEGLPDALTAEIAQSTWQERWRDGARLAGTLIGLVGAFLSLERRKRGFYARLDHALGTERPDLSHWRADELAAYYRRLESQLLPKWDAPLINDFFAMIFFGLLRSLAMRWCGDQDATLQNNLLMGEGGMISAEPARRVHELAQLAQQAEAAHPGLLVTLLTGSTVEIEQMLAHAPALAQAYAGYLDRFGDRCMNELKLESRTLFDDPLPLWRSVAQLARRDSAAHVQSAETVQAARAAAQAQVAVALQGKPVRRWIFRWVLRNARQRVRDRENLRFERTRVFGRARQIFRELGKRFYAVQALDDPHDVFYLQVDEVLGYVDGTTASAALAGLAAVRKAEFEAYRAEPGLERRFETRGMVHQGGHQANHFVAQAQPGETKEELGEERQGLGCCPGVVRGRARVVENPLDARFDPGDILVAPHTDPSWIMIMPLAAGLLVERGSLLSHAAIVARELGIPAVVSLHGVMEWLQDGDLVELDGATGRVRRVEGSLKA